MTSLVLGDGITLVAAGVEALRKRGYVARALEPLTDEPVDRAVETHLSALAREISGPPGNAIVSGGEAPVRVTGPGRGGRCSEFVLRMAEALWIRRAIDLRGRRVTVAAMASDGTDGPTDAAGGWLTEAHVRGREERLRACLAANDSLMFLEESETALKPGPSAVNLMDLRAIVLEG